MKRTKEQQAIINAKAAKTKAANKLTKAASIPSENKGEEPDEKEEVVEIKTHIRNVDEILDDINPKDKILIITTKTDVSMRLLNELTVKVIKAKIPNMIRKEIQELHIRGNSKVRFICTSKLGKVSEQYKSTFNKIYTYTL